MTCLFLISIKILNLSFYKNPKILNFSSIILVFALVSKTVLVSCNPTTVTFMCYMYDLVVKWGCKYFLLHWKIFYILILYILIAYFLFEYLGSLKILVLYLHLSSLLSVDFFSPLLAISSFYFNAHSTFFWLELLSVNLHILWL